MREACLVDLKLNHDASDSAVKFLEGNEASEPHRLVDAWWKVGRRQTLCHAHELLR